MYSDVSDMIQAAIDGGPKASRRGAAFALLGVRRSDSSKKLLMPEWSKMRFIYGAISKR
jgi:hypothetical protein